MGHKNADGSVIDFLNQDSLEKLLPIAKSNRDQFLCDAKGNRLTEADYLGTILPTNACPKL